MIDLVEDFDAGNLRFVGSAFGKLDSDLSGGIGSGDERFGDGAEFSAGDGEDVKIGEHLRAVDDDMELAVAVRSHRRRNFGKMKADRVIRAGDKIGECVG